MLRYVIFSEEILDVFLYFLVDPWKYPLNAWKVVLVCDLLQSVILEHLNIFRLGAVNK